MAAAPARVVQNHGHTATQGSAAVRSTGVLQNIDGESGGDGEVSVFCVCFPTGQKDGVHLFERKKEGQEEREEREEREEQEEQEGHNLYPAFIEGVHCLNILNTSVPTPTLFRCFVMLCWH